MVQIWSRHVGEKSINETLQVHRVACMVLDEVTAVVYGRGYYQGTYKATWKRESQLPWLEAGPPNYLDDEVDSDQ